MRYLVLLKLARSQGKSISAAGIAAGVLSVANHMDVWYAQAYNPAQIEGRENEDQAWEL